MTGRRRGTWGILWRMSFTAALLCLTGPLSRAQASGVVCNNGFGHFDTKFSTGVSVRVGATRQGSFAQRSCEAALAWRGQQVVAVPSAAKVDIDVLGANLGLGMPVVAFEFWKSSYDWQAVYEIYSLDKHPHLLRTITGGDEYRAIDADFNQRVTIWTTDAAAVNGLDGLPYADYDAPPTVVLDFEHGKLMDVSAWYKPQYDKQIAQLRGELSARSLNDFRASDGQLASASIPAAAWNRLRKTKVKVLEIVWAYLYSGRADQAWAELHRDWPPADAARIKAAILAARAKGIEAQAAGMALAKLPRKWNDASLVHQYLLANAPVAPVRDQLPNIDRDDTRFASEGGQPQQPDYQGTSNDLAAKTAPQAILVWRPTPSAAEAAQASRWETMMLTIDEAGKVHAARMVDPASDPELVKAAMNWRFIPAFRSGKPVAYKLKFQVTPYR